MTATILIVDDLEPNIKLLEAKLINEYYTVFSANSGQKALEILDKHKVDIVLLDVMMPDMDGFETCVKIKENPKTTYIPVVMITALSDVEDRIKGLEAGADEFLTKPINDVALFARVRSLSRMKSIIDELQLRNKTNIELGISTIEITDNFTNNKILIINDDAVQAKNIKAILEQISGQIKVINNTDELVLIDSYIPDLILISCQLEKEDPLRISVMLKSKEILQHTILVLLAEEENITMVIKGMELGVNDYFMYPLEKHELLARVKTQLRKKKYQDDLRNALELSVDMSIKDGLTNLFDRRYFDTHIKLMTKAAQDNHQPLCLLMFDIDDFKQANDTYGHLAGDKILETLSITLKNLFRITDLIARYGGEEFVVLLSNTSIEDAKNTAERARKTIESINFNIPTHKTPLKKTVSIGVAEYKENESVLDFINRADKSLYQAKTTGKNRIAISA